MRVAIILTVLALAAIAGACSAYVEVPIDDVPTAPANCVQLEAAGGIYMICDVVTPQGNQCVVIVRTLRWTNAGAIGASIDCDWEVGP